MRRPWDSLTTRDVEDWQAVRGIVRSVVRSVVDTRGRRPSFAAPQAPIPASFCWDTPHQT
eukprot:scaffold112238_cov28-Tisochrysis_lutea.AAC.4